MLKFFSLQSKIFLLTLSIIVVPNIFAQSIFTKYPEVEGKSNPSIITERNNYKTNEIVRISGTNFLRFERINLNIKYLDNNLSQEILLSNWDTYADRNGRMSADWKVFDVNQPDTLFIVEATGTFSGKTTKTEFSTPPLAGEAVDISQCANSNATPQNLDCPPTGSTGWVTGNVNHSKARHFEGDSIAYRNIMTGLNVGKSYKWRVFYDTSKGGLNAIDYLTTYNRTITNANPCANGATVNGFCTFASPSSTFVIPGDPNVANGRNQVPGGGDDIIQAAGNITAWGATITAVTIPTYTGTFPGGDSEASVDITFTANSATAVIAWGGHISTRSDWGQTFGSVNITGSPYHTSNGGLMNLTDTTSCCGGSQDLQLTASAVTPSARIIIKKHATPPSPQPFEFSATNLSPSPFTLIDNSGATDPMQVFDNINTFNLKTITETNNGAYDLISIVCTIDVGTGGTPTPVRTGDSIAIDIKSGDQVTCTFNNDFITAAAVSVGGRVLNSSGFGLGRAIVSMTDGNGNVRSVISNPFGYYKFNNVGAGESYFFEIHHKSYVYTPQLITINEELRNLDFFPNP